MVIASNHDSNVVHWMGVEPTPVARLAPETSAYTNSATSARRINIHSGEANVEFLPSFLRVWILVVKGVPLSKLHLLRQCAHNGSHC